MPKLHLVLPNLLTTVHPDNFCNLDHNLLRLDHLQRPELNKGTVDFLVPEEYWALEQQGLNPSYTPVGPSSKKEVHRPPHPMNYVFAFDISVDAVKSGFLRSSCDALRTTIYQETEEGVVCRLPTGSKVAIISYDCVVNVYNLVGHPRVHGICTDNNRFRTDPKLRMCSLCRISKTCFSRWGLKFLLIL